jgi:GSH-dependent disulfide-bond oxidoreductase
MGRGLSVRQSRIRPIYRLAGALSLPFRGRMGGPQGTICRLQKPGKIGSYELAARWDEKRALTATGAFTAIPSTLRCVARTPILLDRVEGASVIRVYGTSSPNVIKVTVMLEEVGLPYETRHVDVFSGKQHDPDFLKISPNNKVPVILDDSGEADNAVFESGAILIYLAEKTKALLPETGPGRQTALEWLMVQVSSVGPMFGQLVHFSRFAPPGNEYGLARYTSEVRRILSVLDRRLSQAEFLGGATYTIADVSTWPWIRTASTYFGWLNEDARPGRSAWPALDLWYRAVAERPAVHRGVESAERFLAKDQSAFASATPDALDRVFNRGRHAY